MRQSVFVPDMFETVLHTGLEHPNLLWIVLPAIAAFLVGMVVGARSERLRKWARSTPAESTGR